MNKPLLGFSGTIGAGKDTAGEYLVEKHGWHRFAFADVLKESVKVLFDFSNEQLYGKEKEILDERWHVSPRWVLQWLGTDIMRNQFETNFFIKRARITLQKLMENPDVKGIVVTDVRFDNEAALVREFKGRVVQLTRDHGPKKGKHHESENGLQEEMINVYMKNNSTIMSFQDDLDFLVL